MKLLFFDEEERTYSIENEEQMRSFILSGELDGKTLVYDYENDKLEKASQISEFSRINNKIRNEETGRMDPGDGNKGINFRKTMSAGEKFIINNKSFAGKKKNYRGCLIGFAVLVLFGSGLITMLVKEFNGDSSNIQVTTNFSNEPNDRIPFEYLFLVDSIKSYERNFLMEYDSLMKVYSLYNIKGFLDLSFSNSRDSLILYKKKTNELKALVGELKSIENKRFLDFLSLINTVSSSDSLDIKYLPVLINKAQDGNKMILSFYDIELRILNKFNDVYDFFLSIRDQFKLENGQIIFDKTEHLDRFNELSDSIKALFADEEKWIKSKDNAGIFTLYDFN